MAKLTGKKIAILTEDGFEEIELTSPKEALEEAGAEVHIVSPKTDKVRAKEGDEWKGNYAVDVQLKDAAVADYDGLLIPGGVINPDKIRTNKDALHFVRSFFEHKKPVAAICHGPQVLISADVVKDRRLTSVDAVKIDLVNAGAHWEDSEVVTDQGIVTSRTPKDLPAFNKKIVEEFAEGKHDRQHA